MGNGVFKALTFSDFSASDDIKTVCQNMFSTLQASGICYQVKMKPTPNGTTADAYVYCASPSYGFIHIRDHNGTDYCGRVRNGAWSWDTYALKSDLFGELCTNPNTLTAFVAMVNGYDSNVTNIPDAAKKKFSIIQNVWASPSDMGDLTKTHMQVLIIGNGGGVVTRKYESNAWSNWQ